jgi:hypothetical protein
VWTGKVIIGGFGLTSSCDIVDSKIHRRSKVREKLLCYYCVIIVKTGEIGSLSFVISSL